MKINSIEQVNFKSLHVKDEWFSERERMLADDISRKLLGRFKFDDEKCRTWNEWLKKEKGIDIFVKRANDTQDMLTVFGLKNVKDFDYKLKDLPLPVGYMAGIYWDGELVETLLLTEVEE